MKKRIIGMTTAIAMALSMVPASVGAAELNQDLFPKGDCESSYDTKYGYLNIGNIVITDNLHVASDESLRSGTPYDLTKYKVVTQYQDEETGNKYFGIKTDSTSTAANGRGNMVEMVITTYESTELEEDTLYKVSMRIKVPAASIKDTTGKAMLVPQRPNTKAYDPILCDADGNPTDLYIDGNIADQQNNYKDWDGYCQSLTADEWTTLTTYYKIQSTSSKKNTVCVALKADTNRLVGWEYYIDDISLVPVAFSAVAPVASKAAITGGAATGTELQGSYVYYDKNGDPEGATVKTWYMADSADAEEWTVAGTGDSLLLTEEAHANKYIKFGVKPVSTVEPFEGTEVFSDVLGPVQAPTVPQISDLKVSGYPIVGFTLKAAYTYSNGDGSADESIINWYDASTEELLYTGKAMTLTDEYLGKSFKVEVKAKAATGKEGNTLISAATSSVRNAGKNLFTDGEFSGEPNFRYNLLNIGNLVIHSAFEAAPGVDLANKKQVAQYTDDSGNKYIGIKTDKTSNAAQGRGNMVELGITTYEDLLEEGVLYRVSMRIKVPADSVKDISGKAMLIPQKPQTGGCEPILCDADGNPTTLFTDGIITGKQNEYKNWDGYYQILPADEWTTLETYYRVKSTGSGEKRVSIDLKTDTNRLVDWEYFIDDLKLEVVECAPAAPVAENVEISGSSTVGGTLNVSYTYSDDNGDPENGTVIKWYRANNSADDGELIATAETYTTVEEDIGKYIYAEVIPANNAERGSEGAAVKSANRILIESEAVTVTSAVISGEAAVGSVLTLNYSLSDGSENNNATVQWYRDDKEIEGARETTYTVTYGDRGTTISAGVRPFNGDLEGRSNGIIIPAPLGPNKTAFKWTNDGTQNVTDSFVPAGYKTVQLKYNEPWIVRIKGKMDPEDHAGQKQNQSDKGVDDNASIFGMSIDGEDYIFAPLVNDWINQIAFTVKRVSDNKTFAWSILYEGSNYFEEYGATLANGQHTLELKNVIEDGVAKLYFAVDGTEYVMKNDSNKAEDYINKKDMLLTYFAGPNTFESIESIEVLTASAEEETAAIIPSVNGAVITVNEHNGTQTPVGRTIIGAVYDSNGQLKKTAVCTEAGSVLNASTDEAEYTIDFTDIYTQGDTVKCFIWDSLGGMKPVRLD